MNVEAASPPVGGRGRPALIAAGLFLSLLVPACGSGSGNAPTSILLSIWNGDGTDAAAPPARPTVLHLSWLDDAGFLFRDRAVDIAAGTDDFLGSLLIGAQGSATGSRRVFARGLAGGKAVSEGWGSGQMVPGVQERPLSMRMLVLPDTAMDPYDQDGDMVPDAVDICPTLADPDQLPTDC